MGSCWSRSDFSNDNRYRSQRTYYFRREDTVEFEEAPVETESPTTEQPTQSRFKCISALLSSKHIKWRRFQRMKLVPKRRDPRSSSMEAGRDINRIIAMWPYNEQDYSNRTFECLDPLALERQENPLSGSFGMIRWKATQQTGDTPPGSLDLEWEHEELVSNNYSLVPSASEEEMLVAGKANTNSTNMQSQASSTNSLEWDTLDVAQRFGSQPASNAPSQIDLETEHLISEIEKLTSTALQETGHIIQGNNR